MLTIIFKLNDSENKDLSNINSEIKVKCNYTNESLNKDIIILIKTEVCKELNKRLEDTDYKASIDDLIIDRIEQPKDEISCLARFFELENNERQSTKKQYDECEVRRNKAMAELKELMNKNNKI